MSRPTPPPPRPLLGVSLLVYGPMAALGIAWACWREGAFEPGAFELSALLLRQERWLALDGPLAPHLASTALGAALAAVTVLGTRRLTRAAAWARRLHLAFRALLGPLSRGAILGLALTSGIGEELFFRLGMQPSLGWVLTSLIFGAVHVGPGRQFLVWTAWAAVMGLLFGAIYEATGSLAGPVLAHVAINYWNLRFIVAHDPRPAGERPDRPGDARLVARHERR